MAWINRMPPKVKVGSVPFEEAIKHLEEKIQIPTAFSSDLRGQANAKGFAVAGAMKADLLNDFHVAVTEALKNGESIGDFRKRFDKIVDEHGWSYRGKRGWRTRVIYDTNMRTARAAGKWQQFQRVKEQRPYLIYQTVGDERVRPEHAAWNGTVLPIDDPWWDTHYPPNGWGCRCTVRSASQRDLDRQGLEVSGSPAVDNQERVDTRTGEDLGQVPKGIDTGWDYNVGKAWLGPDLAFGQNAMKLPDPIQAVVLKDTNLFGRLIQKPYTGWASQAMQRDTALGEVRTVGYLNHKTISHATKQGVSLETATITLSDDQLISMRKELKVARGTDLSAEAVLMIPTILARPQAVLWDKEAGNLLYVFGQKEGKSADRIVLRVEFKKGDAISNTIGSARRIPEARLSDASLYDLIEGGF
jgi:SPP1 gp7 family putative phage head morphogenesis protein